MFSRSHTLIFASIHVIRYAFLAATQQIALLLCVAACCAAARAEEPWHNDFEAGPVSWRAYENDVPYRLQQHQRVQGQAHGGTGCEWLQIAGENGSFIYFGHDIGRPSVCQELTPSVWVKSDRPGLQLAARVVLPRTIDPRTGQPLVTTVAGPSYSEVGRWQMLQLTDMVRLLSRQVRVLRVEHGPQVDGREAYVESILLNVYGGPGVTNVWLDDLTVTGFVAVSTPPVAPPVAPVANAGGWNVRGAASNAPAGSQTVYPETNMAGWTANNAVAPAAAVESKRHNVRLSGSVLQADGYPLFPRIVQYSGEPLATLKQLGFNTVWLPRFPTPEVLEEAERQGLWLVCSAPRPTGDPQTANGGASDGLLAPAALSDIGPQFDCVLAWNLGNDLTAADLDATRQWAEQVRSADRRNQRPLICRPQSDLRDFSRVGDVLLVDRRPLGTSLDLGDYGEWLGKQRLLALGGTSIWTTIQTQPTEALRQQLATLEPNTPLPGSVAPEQIRLLTYTAISAGSRGVLFLSETPLDATDPETRQRAAALQLLNMELELLRPWIAAGRYLTAATATPSQITGAVLSTEHSRLALPMWSAVGSQCVSPQAAANNVSLIVPGIPDTYRAFEITASGITPLERIRGTGGMHVALTEFGLTSQVLFTQEPVVIADVQRRAQQMGRKAAELQHQLAAYKFSAVQGALRSMPPRISARDTAAWFAAAQGSLQRCDSELKAGDFSNAALSAQRATRALRLIERAYWEDALKYLASPVTSPAATSFATLPLHWRLVYHILGSPRGPNLLVGGDFENREQVLGAGWQHIRCPTPNVQSDAAIVPEAAHSGAAGLRLVAVAENPEKPPVVIESAPVIFRTPPEAVEAGQIVCIHGWVNVPTSITGNVDGLLIIDSLSGEPLADRIQRTSGWREFALYRAAAQAGQMSILFALSGLGEAQLDDLAIEILQRPTGGTKP